MPIKRSAPLALSKSSTPNTKVPPSVLAKAQITSSALVTHLAGDALGFQAAAFTLRQ